MITLAAILALAVQAAPQVTPAVGSLVGCASDAMNQRIPGATVVATTGRVHWNTTTDAGGCYKLTDLPIGSYRVTARLTAFYNVTRDAVSIVAGRAARLDFAMQLSPICECVVGGSTSLAEQWDHADAALHVRLAAPESQSMTPVGYYRHVASLIDALKMPADSIKTPVFVLQNQSDGAPEPYDIGQEAVIFLRSSGSNGFVITTEVDGRDNVFLIQDSHIQRAPSALSRYVGMSLDTFLAELRALPRGK